MFVCIVASQHVEQVSYLTNLFVGKPPKAILPDFSAHTFSSNQQLALLESVKEGKKVRFKESAQQEGTGRLHMKWSGHAPILVTMSGCDLLAHLSRRLRGELIG